MYHTTNEIDELFGGPPTTLTHMPRLPLNSRPIISKKKQTKTRATSYKKELSDFLKHTATKKFGEVCQYKSRDSLAGASSKDTDKSGFPLKRTEKQIQSLKNWKKHCVKIYEADFQKECMLEVGGQFFMKPTTIPESISALTELCNKFHEQIEGAHGKKVPFTAGLYKATIQRFDNMRNIKVA